MLVEVPVPVHVVKREPSFAKQVQLRPDFRPRLTVAHIRFSRHRIDGRQLLFIFRRGDPIQNQINQVICREIADANERLAAAKVFPQPAAVA